MDKCTHEVRKQRWKNIISQCLQRPEGMIESSGLTKTTFANRVTIIGSKIRQETYELATTTSNTACVKTMNSEVTFAEVPLLTMNPVSFDENGFRPNIIINTGSVIIGVFNTALSRLLRIFCVGKRDSCRCCRSSQMKNS